MGSEIHTETNTGVCRETGLNNPTRPRHQTKRERHEPIHKVTNIEER